MAIGDRDALKNPTRRRSRDACPTVGGHRATTGLRSCRPLTRVANAACGPPADGRRPQRARSCTPHEHLRQPQRKRNQHSSPATFEASSMPRAASPPRGRTGVWRNLAARMAEDLLFTVAGLGGDARTDDLARGSGPGGARRSAGMGALATPRSWALDQDHHLRRRASVGRRRGCPGTGSASSGWARTAASSSPSSSTARTPTPT